MAGSLLSVALLVSAACLVQGNNQPPPLPVNSQIGILHFPITCTLDGSIKQTFDLEFTGTAPAYGNSGQEIYLTDAAGFITIPAAVGALAKDFNASQATANFSITLDISNASPASLLAYQTTLYNISIPSTASTLRFPAGNGTLPALGPFTLGTSEEVARLTLGTTNVTLELQDSAGNSVSGPIPISCGEQNIEYILGSVSVDNSTTGGAPYAPSNGYVPAFPETAESSEYGFFRFPYDCTFGTFGEQSLDLTIGGTLATYFAPGEPFYLTNGEGFLRIPSSLVSLAKSAYPSVTTFKNTITAFDILFTNANPSSFNVATTPLVSYTDVCNTDSAVAVPIPQTGNLTVGPVTAGANGTIVSVAVGDADGTTALLDGDGNVLATVPVTCRPIAPLELIGIAVTTLKPDNYSLGQNQNANSSAAMVKRYARKRSKTLY